jgi:hypothetical protein
MLSDRAPAGKSTLLHIAGDAVAIPFPPTRNIRQNLAGVDKLTASYPMQLLPQSRTLGFPVPLRLPDDTLAGNISSPPSSYPRRFWSVESFDRFVIAWRWSRGAAGPRLRSEIILRRAGVPACAGQRYGVASVQIKT